MSPSRRRRDRRRPGARVQGRILITSGIVLRATQHKRRNNIIIPVYVSRRRRRRSSPRRVGNTLRGFQ